MAKKRRKMSAKQKKYFGKRRKSRTVSTSTKSYKRSSSSKKKILGVSMPLDLGEGAIDFIAGAIAGPISDRTKPLQVKYLGNLGKYSDEGAWSIIGTAAYNWGGRIHPSVKKVGKELFRVAVISAGQQAGTGLVNQIFNRGATRSSSPAAAGSFR